MRRPVRTWLKRMLRGFACLLAVTMLGGLGLCWYLQGVGIPEFASRRVRAAARAAGMLLDVGRIRMDFPHGIHLEQVRMAAGTGPGSAHIEAMSVHVRIPWVRALTGRMEVSGLVGRGVRIAFDGIGNDTAGEAARLTAGSIRIERQEDAVHVRLEEGELLGVQWTAEGRISGLPFLDPNRDPDVPLRERSVPYLVLPEPARRMIGRILDAASVAALPRGARLDAVFDIDARDWVGSRVRADLQGGAGEWRGLMIDGLSAVISWEERTARVERFSLDLAPGQMTGTAVWSPSAGFLTLEAEGEGPWSTWRRPLPGPLRNALDEIQVGGSGRIAWHWKIDGEPLREAMNRGVGWLHGEGLALDGIAVERIRFDLGWDRPVLRFEGIEGRIGRGDIEGDLTLDLTRKHLSSRFRGTVDPDVLHPWLMPLQSRYVGATVFLGDPPHAEGEIVGFWGRKHSLQLRCRVRGSHVVYSGSHLDSVEADVVLDGPLLRFEQMRITRAEGDLEGWVRQNLAESVADFDIESRLHPYAVARTIGPAAHRFVQRFRFEGPVHVKARGQVRTGPAWSASVTAEAEGSNLGMERFLLQQAAFRFSMEERSIRVDDLHGVYAGGVFEGSAWFEVPAEASEPTAYGIEVDLDDVDLAIMAADLAREDASSYEGRLDGRLELEGRMGKGQGPTARGSGQVRVEGAGLLRIPIFGGLSAWLSRLYPGLGFFSQDVFYAPFTVADSRVSSESITLEGGVLSARGRGDVFFDRRLNIRIQVRLLRRGIVAEVLRLITAPLTKLLEFDLGGTVSEPRWRPRNFSGDIDAERE